MSILFDQNFQTRTKIDWHEEDGDVVLDHQQDVEPLIEWNKGLRNQHDGSLKGDVILGWHVPTNVVEDLIRRGIYHDRDRWNKWLRSEEGLFWKIHPGDI